MLGWAARGAQWVLEWWQRETGTLTARPLSGSSPCSEVKPLLDSCVLVQFIKSNSSPSPVGAGEAAVESAVVFGGRH